MLRRVFTSSDANSQGEGLVLLIEQLMAEPNYNSLIGQLDMILIERAKVTIRDVKTGLTWTAPSARARLKRDAEGVNIAASAKLTGDAGNWVDVSLSGVYTRDRSRVSLSTPPSTASSRRCWPTCRPTSRCCAASTSCWPAGCKSRRTAMATCAASRSTSPAATAW